MTGMIRYIHECNSGANIMEVTNHFLIEDSLHRGKHRPRSINQTKKTWLGTSQTPNYYCWCYQMDIVSNCLLNTYLYIQRSMQLLDVIREACSLQWGTVNAETHSWVSHCGVLKPWLITYNTPAPSSQDKGTHGRVAGCWYEPMVGKDCCNQCLLDLGGLVHSWVQNRYLHKTCTRSIQSTFQHLGERHMKPYTWLRSYWQLMGTGEGRIVCFRGMVPGRLPMLQWMVPHLYLYKH